MKLKDKDIVCFLGDSITCAGWWEAELFEKVAPLGVKVYNCGVSGNTSFTAFERIYTDCLVYSPTIVCVMLGVNDISAGTTNRKSPDIASKIDGFVVRYQDYLERIILAILDSGAKVVLCDPPPYFEGEGKYSTIDTGCNCDLDRCRQIIYQMANKYGLEVIKVNEALMQASKQKQVSDDRVHPNLYGYKVLAQTVEKFFELPVDDSTEFNFSDVNKERFDAEQHYKDICYMEYDVVANYSFRNGVVLDREQKLKLASGFVNDSNEYISRTAKVYLNEIDNLDKARGKMVEKTIKMFKAKS